MPSITDIDPATSGVLDRPENLSYDTVARAAELAAAFIEDLDRPR